MLSCKTNKDRNILKNKTGKSMTECTRKQIKSINTCLISINRKK